MNGRVPLTFEPAGVTVWIEPGTSVLEAAREARVVIAAPCGGRGVCGACGVVVTAGSLAAADADEAAGLRRARPGVRLACRARVTGAATVRPLAVSAEPTAAAAEGNRCHPVVAGVDLGTTSVAAVLVDRASMVEVGRGAVRNDQQLYGADILSRIAAAGEPDGASELRRLAEQSVVAALTRAAGAAGCEPSAIRRVVVAGNSAMAGLFAGADVSALGRHPFTAPDIPERIADGATRLGLSRDTAVELVSPIAGFVGGDALAAVIAAGMVDADEPTLLVDFGTNAEIVLAGVRGKPLVVSSAAAGPAFEGAGISCGGPAIDGAVTRLCIDSSGIVRLEVLGDCAPVWLTGSGIVSAVAELRRAGHIDASGLLNERGPLEERFFRDERGVLAVRLGEDPPLALTQLDVRALQLAKAAVAVGVDSVLAAAGLAAGDVGSVLVAGAFGSALQAEDLVELGVLPGVLGSRIRPMGNAALDGAALFALEPELRALASEATAGALHVDLALDAAFNQELVAATDLRSR